MTEQTRCPACGAPLSAAEQQDVVICDFCNTAIRVIREDDEERFEVLSQPEPQKDVLSQPVDPLVEDVLFGESAPEDEPVLASEGTERPVEGMASFWQPAPDEPAASGSGDTFFAPPPPVSPAPFSETTGGAQVFPPISTPTTGQRGLGGLPRWAVIVIAVVAVLCLVCACGVAALFALFMNSGTTTF